MDCFSQEQCIAAFAPHEHFAWLATKLSVLIPKEGAFTSLLNLPQTHSPWPFPHHVDATGMVIDCVGVDENGFIIAKEVEW